MTLDTPGFISQIAIKKTNFLSRTDRRNKIIKINVRDAAS